MGERIKIAWEGARRKNYLNQLLIKKCIEKYLFYQSSWLWWGLPRHSIRVKINVAWIILDGSRMEAPGHERGR